MFFIAGEFLTQPGVFGLVMAALTAALMSTVDTLITAIAAIVVNDIYKPSHPQLMTAVLSVALVERLITVLGVALVPVGELWLIYAAHGGSSQR